MKYTGVDMVEEQKTIDVSQGTTVGASEEGEPKQAKGGALSGLSRLLSEKEMEGGNPAAFKLILDRVDTLQTEVQGLEKFRKDYYEEHTRAEVLEEKLKSLDESINSRSFFILVGGLFLGYLPSLWGNDGLFIAIIIIALLFLFLGFLKVIVKAFK